jgi:hypothetical protein
MVGQWLSVRWARELIDQFDEDWHRNPRAIEAVRDRLAQVPPIALEEAELTAALGAFTLELTARL